ncbi:glycosyltransferase family 4 protein [Crocosphaera sp. XPORK-15E]|uniref:glycosyltransferase family 4 protein n=1 Tax=Crocosphaera sp. XPORK-15E TaxID=3110247 RepID=UPI002B2000A3|nr:glycosyltransferase family 4 protein [Crocosphaera sp. XPORK-15E]MEA5537055.1 glycosyltransferase family 4 protein [Crocosphaera sp. XPORK-15E]
MTENALYRKQSLNIGLLHWTMPPTTGGVESHIADLALALTEAGCGVTVMTGEPIPTPLTGVEIIYIPSFNLNSLQTGDSDSDNLEAILETEFGDCIIKRQLKVVHGHNLHHFFPEPALALDRLRKKLDFLLHHTFHETWPDVLHKSPIYRQWDANYAVSRFVQSECACRIGFEPDLLPLGIDTKRFRAQKPPLTKCDKFVILHPARILPWKGVHISVEMLAHLRDRGIEARLIITDTQRIIDWNHSLVSYHQKILEQIKNLHLTNLVEFRSVPYQDIHYLYEEADVVVYPTVGEEPYGLVPLEAMSMARPIVASRSGGMTETIVDGETGFLVDRGNSIVLADRVEKLLKNPQLSQNMGQAGRQRVLDNFDGGKYSRELIERYLSDHQRDSSFRKSTENLDHFKK